MVHLHPGHFHQFQRVNVKEVEYFATFFHIGKGLYLAGTVFLLYHSTIHTFDCFFQKGKKSKESFQGDFNFHWVVKLIIVVVANIIIK